MKAVNVQLEDDMHTALKVRAGLTSKTAKQLITEGLAIRLSLTEEQADQALAKTPDLAKMLADLGWPYRQDEA